MEIDNKNIKMVYYIVLTLFMIIALILLLNFPKTTDAKNTNDESQTITLLR